MINVLQVQLAARVFDSERRSTAVKFDLYCMVIWNREPYYRNRVFSTYRFGTSTYWYVLSTDQYRKREIVQTSTYKYVLSNSKYVPK